MRLVGLRVLMPIVLASLALAPIAALATSVTVMGAVVPSAQFSPSAVWDGRAHAFIFTGGVDSYHPQNDKARPTSASLPPGQQVSTSAVWNGHFGYIFGGVRCDSLGCHALNLISRYDPTTNSVTLMNGKLPSGRNFTSAVWTGRYAFIFGGAGDCGSSGCVQLNQIVRYDPSADSVQVMSATLPGQPEPGNALGGPGRVQTSAVWDGQNAYIFGGCCAPDKPNDIGGFNSRIVRYNPASDTTTIMGATLPFGRARTSAVWDGQNADGQSGSGQGGSGQNADGRNAYVFGGGWCTSKSSCGDTDQIVRYNPAADTVNVMTAVLPSPRESTAAVWDTKAGVAYIFGGSSTNGVSHDTVLDQIIRFVP